jgi:tRNA (guanine-N7-)-methyltransferase
MTDHPQGRRIRSFVLRTGRMTPGQRRAINTHWQEWGLSLDSGPLQAGRVFGRSAPLVLEIGFGMGSSLAAMAAAAPTTDFLGIEVHKPGVGRLFAELAEAGTDNVRAYCDDAVPVLEQCIEDGSLHGVQIFFPDPWHKKKHHKRRLIQAEFVQLLSRKLEHGGFLHLATDWEHYGEHMREVLENCPEFDNQAGPGAFSQRPASRPLTKFEQRGQRLGHGVWDLLYTRC